MIIRRCILAGLLLGAAAQAPAHAAGDPNAARGIVAEYCVACHVVPGYAPRYGRAPVDAPPFQTIADQPAVYTSERLHKFLQQPHFPMTKFTFSPSDIDNLIAFIESLRKS